MAPATTAQAAATQAAAELPTATLAEARAQFAPDRGYLSACTLGLPTVKTVEALRTDLAAWHAGHRGPVDYERAVAAGRAHYARLVGVGIDTVAIGSQTSVMAGLIAASVPDGAEVVCVDGDFSSIVFPFMQHEHRGVSVRHVPLEALANSITERTWLLAFSLVQSATGRVADADAIVEAARRAGAVTLCDVTQAAGWMPVLAERFDLTIGHAYKWLCSPRGVAFLTVSPTFAPKLRPAQAGWYAGEDPWQSCYGPNMRLSPTARAFDVSPAWQAWIGAEPALELFAGIDPAVVAAYDGGLGDALCDGLGIEQHGQAIVTWPDADGEQLALLTDAGLVASGRAGRARVAFHLWNDEDDVEAVLRALR
jgi:selenocysteine lyase/cysteine desulfurase